MKNNKLTQSDLIDIREIIPLAGNVIRRIHKQHSIFEIVNTLKSPASVRFKKDYIYALDLDEHTLDKIWERFGGDMYITTKIYGEQDACL